MCVFLWKCLATVQTSDAVFEMLSASFSGAIFVGISSLWIASAGLSEAVDDGAVVDTDAPVVGAVGLFEILLALLVALVFAF